MIRVRTHRLAPIEEMELPEFEARARRGDIAPQHEICVPELTGAAFVPARELTLFRGLYAEGTLTFHRHFNLGRMPYVTLALIGMLIAIFVTWQGGGPLRDDDLLRHGAKSRVLIVELGQWWRLLSANLLHRSWFHLLGNAIFLLNLGGATEAIFRRLDYVLIVVVSGLSASLVSAALNPALSCGSSGVVFGVWGAAAVFGIRHRDILPRRYRRFFILSVIPYSLFALYLGITFDGVDNWAHVGGLAAGAGVALFLPARLTHPQDAAAPAKLLALALTAFAIGAGSLVPAGPGPLANDRFRPQLGLRLGVPDRWRTEVARSEVGRESYAFTNPAGVAIALEAFRGDRPLSLETLRQRFVDTDLGEVLKRLHVEQVTHLAPNGFAVAGTPATRLRTELHTRDRASRADFLLIARGHYHYVVMLSAPIWLAEGYRPIFDAIAASLTLVDPAELGRARAAAALHDDAPRRAELALALHEAGQEAAALDTLAQARARWPRAIDPQLADVRLLLRRGDDLPRACGLMQTVLAQHPWNVALVHLAVEAYDACDRRAAATRLLDTALIRMPHAAALQSLRDVRVEAAP